MASWIQCPKTHKLIPREEYNAHLERNSSYVQDDISPFVSPVDGSVISSRSALRHHNQRHGVTDPRDYGDTWFARKKKERDEVLTSSSKACKRERVEAIQEAIYRLGG